VRIDDCGTGKNDRTKANVVQISTPNRHMDLVGTDANQRGRGLKKTTEDGIDDSFNFGQRNDAQDAKDVIHQLVNQTDNNV